MQVRESEFRTNEIFVQSDVEFLRHAFRRRILHRQTGVPGKRSGRAKRTGNTRSTTFSNIVHMVIDKLTSYYRFGTSFVRSDVSGKET